MLDHVHLPTTAIISLLCVMEDCASAEIAIIGNEGAVGVSLFTGGESTRAAPSCNAPTKAFA
jgi:hypothetical protein